MERHSTARTMDEYVAGLPPKTRNILQELRATIKAAAPGAEETMNYAIPTFKLNGNLVHFAAFENHVGFYPTPSGITAFKKELAKYKSSKGSVQFPLDQPMPLQLVGRIVKFRVAEQLKKSTVKKPKSK
jgi:uncharacterized protein YdhG (YjbR/CyaY superfamily)